MRIFDSHCHLDHEQFADDLSAVLERARAAGITNIITIGASDGLDSAARALAISDNHQEIFASAGVHPHSAGLDRSRAPELEALVANQNVVGIGETGLDFFYDFAARADQQWWFEFQLDLAQRYKKPIIIHCRSAAAEVLATIRRFEGITGVFHCFTESTETAREVLELGWYISVPGIVTFKNSQALRDTIEKVPLERLLIETDAPFLAPIPNRGRRNESAFIVYTLDALARLKNVAPETLAEQTFLNTVQLFNLKDRL